MTVLTSARHLSLSCANSIQSQQPPPTFRNSILILTSYGIHITLKSQTLTSKQKQIHAKRNKYKYRRTLLSHVQKTGLTLSILKINEAHVVIILNACTALNIVVRAVIRFAARSRTTRNCLGEIVMLSELTFTPTHSYKYNSRRNIKETQKLRVSPTRKQSRRVPGS
jgi:hypothetical protein